MLVRYQPLRQLNDNRGLFGLQTSDLGVGIGIFIVLSLFFDDSPFAVLAVPGAILSILCLAPIRLMTRRGILRDTARYFLTSKVLFVGIRRPA